MYLTLYLVLFSILINIVYLIQLKDINVPPEHMGYIFNLFPGIAESCKVNSNCDYKRIIGHKSCWGYEPGCNKNVSYHVRPRCPGDHRGWVRTKEAQYDTFYTQADFGNISFKKIWMTFFNWFFNFIFETYRLCKRSNRRITSDV